MEVFDGDKGDKVTMELRGPFSRVFEVNRQGDLIIKELKWVQLIFWFDIVESTVNLSLLKVQTAIVIRDLLSAISLIKTPISGSYEEPIL